MNRPLTSSYGASKAALEMATEVWAKEVEGTGLTIKHRQPRRRRQHPGHGGRNARNQPRGPRPASSSPEEMVSPLLYVVSRKADNVNGYRFEANLLDLSLPPADIGHVTPAPNISLFG
jgi:NAD(P)-dependent dehydrogenase (short-subunit alcohol dehydrogenase family)